MLARPYNEQDLRKRQIDTLKIFNDHVIEVSENSEYRVEFASNGKNMSLTVLLSPEFPSEKPTIFINPPIPHPWVSENSNQVFGAPGLVNYTLHSDLGRVVQAIIREFQKAMPIMSYSEEKEESSPSTASGQSTMFPELNDCCIEELQQILENTDLQDKIIETNPLLTEIDLETDELISNIEEIAQDNINKQQTLESLKTDVIDKISTIVQMKMNFEELNRQHQRLADMYDPHKIRDCLKAAAMRADEESETIAEQFLTGQIPVEVFISKFAEKRGLGQARRAREERLAHQLTQLDRASTKS